MVEQLGEIACGAVLFTMHHCRNLFIIIIWISLINLSSTLPGKCKFQEAWLTNPQYSKWIGRGSSVNEAKCKACKKSFDVQNMGEAALKSHMKSKKHTDAFKGTFVAFQFRSELLSFLSVIVGKVMEKTPIAYSMARNLSCLDPKLTVKDKEVACGRFKIVLKKLVECKRVDIQDCDTLMSQYSEFADRAVQLNKSEFEEFDFTTQRLDTFLQKHIGQVRSLSRLWDVVKSLLSLSHGQASVERGFSIN